ncbi:4-hydroxythreonine-4-phosphate dehydrogenase [Halanaerobium congolense]|jgi:4-hydroxythreonine-4-phosphate dehydrogenase|uniref:4-hydroxythreonine-4-phosphate dehydrogenase n=1 Tax=Halanaerobium congolense TaxID=54121 RepID=A0A318E124_9FIRM|nr:4-hydroxythreonine-4-phosphate dehydrogenase PdxA [Halanaerobium congolense]PXV61058.1 4-hydroxythreonine-4-phosphate dehydrogenase [Halanaerobium congolense]
MSKMKIGITIGDPAGIGPEIVVKSLAKEKIREMGNLYVLGDKEVIREAEKLTGVDLKINLIEDIDQDQYRKNEINLIDLNNVELDQLQYGEVQAMSGQAAYEYIKKSIQLALDGKLDAVATAPINKKSLKAAGVDYIGHTEIFADLTGTEDPLTMFQVFDLRVFFLSRHVSLKKACEMVTEARVYAYLKRCIKALARLGVEDGKLAIAALNPHAGEHGLFGTEEDDEITPAINKAREEGYDVVGPVPADSVFHKGLNGSYDAILSLFHDQGHIATKMVDFERTISLTNNMPFLRTSVDHGTAFDIAGKNIADSLSMEEAIRLAVEYAASFTEA